MPPYSTLLSARSQCGVIVEQRDGCAAKWNVMISVATVRVDGGEVPDGDGELGVGRDGVVVEGEGEPLIPDARSLEVLVGGLGVDGERFGVCKGLDGDV